MFLNRVFKFLLGYVILSLKGISIERFINICVRRGIKLISISKQKRDSAVVSVYMRDLPKLRAPAYKTRTRVHIEKKCGLPMLLRRYRERYAMAAGFAFVAAALAVGSQFVWIVEYEGAENVDTQALRAAVENIGVRPGVLKASLPPGGEMKTAILSNTRDLSWAWVYIKGARVVVSVRRAVQKPQMIDKNVPCDIVAMCDGVITEVTAKSGKAYVKRGDAVSAGDVLVAGTLDGENGYRLIHAEGGARARVFKSVSGEYKLCEDIRKPNGDNKMLFSATLFSKDIKFFGGGSISDEKYDKIENNRYIDTRFGRFGIRTVNARGVDVSRRVISPEEAEEEALYELEEKISSTLNAGATLIQKNTRREMIDGETVRITLDAEFEQDIGLEKEIRIN